MEGTEQHICDGRYLTNMPELPEVEVVRRGLAAHVIGREVATVQVLHERAVRRHVAGAAHFADSLVGTTMVDACRRGKYFWLPLRDAANALMGHLGMSGQLRVLPAHTPDQRHLRVRFTFVDGDPELRFVDQRTFGALAIAPLGDDNVPVPIKHIAPDPLDPHFDEERLFAAFQRRRTGIKRALLDQAVVSGIGNIYADEALWRAFVHYAQPTDTLSVTKARDILDTVRSVLVEALGQGGTSFDTMYVNVNGDSGYFDQSLNVYGREGQPCRRCGTAVRRDPFMNRSSFTCPRCQPEPAGLVGGS